MNIKHDLGDMTPAAHLAPRQSRLARVLAWACGVGAVLLPLVVAWHLLRDWPSSLSVGLLGVPLVLPVAVPRAVLATGLLLAPVLLMAMALWRARGCLLVCAAGQALSRPATGHLRGFALWAFASALASIVAPTLAVLVLTWGQPSGSVFTLSIGSQPLMLLLFSGITWQIAAVIEHAVAIAEDHAQIV